MLALSVVRNVVKMAVDNVNKRHGNNHKCQFSGEKTSYRVYIEGTVFDFPIKVTAPIPGLFRSIVNQIEFWYALL